MAIAQSKNTEVRYGKQSGLGAPVAGGGASKVIRRASTSIQHTRSTFRSAEKRSSGQVANEGHGQNLVSGDVSAELYAGSWTDFWAAVMQRDFDAVSAINASAGDGFTITSNVLTRAAGGGQSFVTNGVRVGQVIRLSGIAASADAGRNCLVSAMTATTLTLAPLDGVALSNIVAPDEDATITVAGKKTYIPTDGHTDDYFTVEDFKRDADLSTVFSDVKVGRVQISSQPNQPVQLTWGFVGTGDTDDYTGVAAPYFTSPTAADSNVMYSTARAYLRLNGTVIAVATGFNLTVDLGLQAPEVIASQIAPEVFRGTSAEITGEMTLYLKDHSIRNLFLNETEVELSLVFESPGAAPRSFFNVFLPRVKVNSATPDDSDTGRVQTVNIRALERPAATGYDATSIMVQDSAAA